MKRTIICLFLLLFVVTLSACGENSVNKTMDKINTTIDKVSNLVINIDEISTDTLTIDSIMDEKDEQHTGYDGATFTSGSVQLDNFINNVLKLSNQAHMAIDINNGTKQLLIEIKNNVDDVKTILEIMSSKKLEINNDKVSSIDDLCNNILTNVNRIMITKDDVNNELKSTVAFKTNYTQNVEQLTSKYVRLCSALESRNTYLQNINSSMDALYEALYFCYRPSDDTESVSKSWSNIDTYENARNKNTNKQNKRNTENGNNFNNYGYDGYGYNGAGYGMNNPYYGYGGYMGGRGYGGYGFGYGGLPYSPYGRYNPYIPNIDTFGTYKNIDTYRPYEDEEDEEIDDDIDYDEPRVKKISIGEG